MARNAHPSSPRFTLSASALPLCVLLLAAGGCSSGIMGKSETPLSTRDFKSSAPAPTTSGDPSTPPTAPATPAVASAPTTPAQPAMPTTTPAAASDNLRDVAVLAGSPSGDVALPSAQASGKPVTIDMLVGQINGKPVYADEFLTPLDGKLNALLSEARNGRDWQDKAAKEIAGQLQQRVQDELLLAEARASLSTEEKRGLISFLTRLRENLASLSQGSAVAADENLRSSDNSSLDSKAKTERDKILLRTLVARNIEPRVNVSWRDIQRQYDRDYTVYNPAPIAYLRLVECKASDTTARSTIEQMIAAGEDFAKVGASKANAFNRSEAGMLDPQKLDKSMTETTFFGDKALNAAAQKLSPGQIAGPIEYKPGREPLVAWIKFEKLETPPGRSLEEAQLDVSTGLQKEKFQAELNRYYSRLVEQGSKTSLTDMLENLVLIASERYLVNGDIPPGIKRTTPTRPNGPQRP
jgi:hypothetical protein